MRAEMWWVGASLSAGIVGGSIFSDLPVVAVVINHNAAEITTTGAMPFEDLSEAAWCAENGGCWRAVRDGLMVSETADTVYEGIGLQDGDVLVAYNDRETSDFSDLLRLSDRLEESRAACLEVYRGQETITMGLLLPEDAEAKTAEDAETQITDPCAKQESHRRHRSTRRSRTE